MWRKLLTQISSRRLHKNRRAIVTTSIRANVSNVQCVSHIKSTINEDAGSIALTIALLSAAIVTSQSEYYLEAEKNDITHIDKDDEHVFLNWSASHECRPIKFHVPESVEQVEQLIKTYNQKKQKLRCMGAGVSPNGLGFSGRYKATEQTNENGNTPHEALMTMALFDKVLNVDKTTGLVEVEAGIIVGNLLDILRTHGLTMQNVASIRDQQLAGICQAGCHGTGAKISPIDDHVVAMEIVTPAFGRMQLSEKENPHLFSLAKCGLGALGVITKMTIQCTPVYYLAEKTIVTTIDKLRANHSKWLKEFQHMRYMWIPYTDSIVVVQCQRITAEEAHANDRLQRFPPVKESNEEQLAQPRQLYLDLCAESRKKPSKDYLNWTFFEMRDQLLAFNPLSKSHIKRVNAAEKAFWLRNQGYRIGRSDEIIGFDCGGQQHVEEVAFPCATGYSLEIDFMEQLLKRIDAENIPAPAPIEQRWTAKSRSAMSPAASEYESQLFSWVGIIMYLPTPDKNMRAAITSKFDEYNTIYRDLMAPFGAIEHWAKIEWPNDPKELETMKKRLNKKYPLDDFRAARDQVDPNHILSNDIVDTLLHK